MTVIKRLSVALALGAFAIALPAQAGPGAGKKKKPPVEEKKPAPTPTPAPASKPAAGGDDFGPQLPPPPPAADAEVTKKPAFELTRGKILVGAKAGAAFAQPFGLGASFLVGVEAGWVLPKLPGIGEGLTLAVDLAYTQPETGGDALDTRVAANGGAYHWSITQRELTLGITVLYRVPFLLEGKLVPYIGIGPRFFFLQQATGGQAGDGVSLAGYTEQSSRTGLGVPLGADFVVGPGRVFVEAQFMWAPQNTNVTGAGSAGGVTAAAGYRFLF